MGAHKFTDSCVRGHRQCRLRHYLGVFSGSSRRKAGNRRRERHSAAIAAGLSSRRSRHEWETRRRFGGNDVDDKDCEMRDQSGEVHRSRRIPSPVKPTQEEIDKHDALEHSQNRSWCIHCVAEELDRDTWLWRSSRDLCLQSRLHERWRTWSIQRRDQGNRSTREQLAHSGGVRQVLKSKTIGANCVQASKGGPFFALIQRMGSREIISKSDGVGQRASVLRVLDRSKSWSRKRREQTRPSLVLKRQVLNSKTLGASYVPVKKGGLFCSDVPRNVHAQEET